MLMSWPQAQEYNEAIQNPHICFQDAELKRGIVKKNAMGIPIAISGGFANVYQLSTSSDRWAIRCFIREVADNQRRYTEISKTLNALGLPYTAQFEFQPAGIRVGPRCYPIVKMRWMSGELLSEFVGKNVYNQPVLAQLADRWARLMADLQANRLAHGDLQHGNVLVVNGNLKLIDYDGMFVPSFDGMRSNEVGHPNFQHPRRRESDFGLYTDNFSAWLIYASIRILAVSPELYSLSRGLGRDECLIFNRDDFANPGASPMFGQLRLHQDATVRRLADQIAGFLSQDPKEVPPLDPSTFPSDATTHPGVEPSSWWRESLQPSAPETCAVAADDVSVELDDQPRCQREMLGFIACSSVAYAVGLSGIIGVAGYSIIQIAIVALAERRLRSQFERCPSVAARDRHYQEVHMKEEEVANRKARLEQNRKRIAESEVAEVDLSAKAQGRITELTASQGVEIRKVTTEQAVAQADLLRRKQMLTAKAEGEVKLTTAPLESEARSVQAQLTQLSNSKAETCRIALDKLRREILQACLCRHPIADAKLPGVGPRYKANLNYAGIQTAADVSHAGVRVVDGFGQSRTSTVVAWRQDLVSLYQSQLPDRVPQNIIDDVEQQIGTHRFALESKLSSLQAKVRNTRESIGKAYESRHTAILVEGRQVTATAQEKIKVIATRFAGEVASIRADLEQRQRNLRREVATAQVSVTHLASDIQRLQSWHSEVGIPRSGKYAVLTYSKFLKKVFFTKLGI